MFYENDAKGMDGLEYGFDPRPERMDLPKSALLGFVPAARQTIIEISAAESSSYTTELPQINPFTGEIAKKILPFIKHALTEPGFKVGSLFDEPFDIRRFVAVVERSMQLAALEIEAVKEIMLEPKGYAWDRRDLLYGVFEEVLIREIFAD